MGSWIAIALATAKAPTVRIHFCCIFLPIPVRAPQYERNQSSELYPIVGVDNQYP
jgi:hypothetical protein